MDYLGLQGHYFWKDTLLLSAIKFYYIGQKANIMNCRWINSTVGKIKTFFFGGGVNCPVKKATGTAFFSPISVHPNLSESFF